MNKETLLRKIKRAAKQDEKNRKDLRYLETMGFLVAKGFLKTNLEIPLLPNKRLKIMDVVWAGNNVEPRILEVLPAAVLRLGKHFDLDLGQHPELYAVVERLKKGEKVGAGFLGIPYDKLKVWADFPLRDRRVKMTSEKKVVKTFRLNQVAVRLLKKSAQEKNCTETEVLEKLILQKNSEL